MRDYKGFGPPASIEPVSHRGNFPWWLIKVPFVLFGTTLFSAAVAWWTIIVDIHGIKEIPELFSTIYDKQSAIVVILPILLTTLYFTINKIGKLWHG